MLQTDTESYTKIFEAFYTFLVPDQIASEHRIAKLTTTSEYYIGLFPT